MAIDKIADVLGISKYVVSKYGDMRWFDLHKYLFFINAYSMAMYREKLIKYPFIAWAGGPALICLYKLHKGNFNECNMKWFKDKKCSVVPKFWKEHIDNVVKVYIGSISEGDYFYYENDKDCEDGRTIVTPWRKARRGLGILDRGHNKIKDSDIILYYGKNVVL